MAGLVPAIHVLLVAPKVDVDARHKAGHDDGRIIRVRRDELGYTLNRSTAFSSQARPRPGPRAVTHPSITWLGSASTMPARSRYSSQCAVGVTGSRWALVSMKMWLDIGSDAASARAAARSQPVMPPIFITSGMT